MLYILENIQCILEKEKSLASCRSLETQITEFRTVLQGGRPNPLNNLSLRSENTAGTSLSPAVMSELSKRSKTTSIR